MSRENLVYQHEYSKDHPELFNMEGREAKAEKILGDELQNHIGDAATNNQPMQVQQDCWAAGDIPCIL
jgi:hypothetical protein